MRTGKKVAIIGSGPSGLAAAAQLNKVRTRLLIMAMFTKPLVRRRHSLIILF